MIIIAIKLLKCVPSWACYHLKNQWRNGCCGFDDGVVLVVLVLQSTSKEVVKRSQKVAKRVNSAFCYRRHSLVSSKDVSKKAGLRYKKAKALRLTLFNLLHIPDSTQSPDIHCQDTFPSVYQTSDLAVVISQSQWRVLLYHVINKGNLLIKCQRATSTIQPDPAVLKQDCHWAKALFILLMASAPFSS